MDSILTQSQFPHRISLSQAAEISGYHQDYLSQLCRLGKIRAAKIGRNWYTTQTELKVLLSGDMVDSENTETISEIAMDAAKPVQVQPAQIEIREIARPSAPVVADNYIISEVDGIPIQLRTQTPARAEHTVQTLITRMKLDTLKQEVLTIAQSVDVINERLAKHEQILEQLQNQAEMRTDLRQTFTPSLTVSPRTIVKPKSLVTIVDEEAVPEMPTQQWVWVVPAIAVMMLVIPLAILAMLPEASSPSFAQTIYYQDTAEAITPQVAGESEVIIE